MKWGDKPRRTFNEAAERFVREHMITIKPSTARRYGDSLKHLALQFGDKTLDEIKSGALSDFETARRSEGVTAATIRRDLSCLSGIFTSAIDWEWIEDGGNPVTSYMRRRAKRGLKEAPPRTRYLSPEEEGALLAAATDGPRLAMALAIDTGLRREELFSLTWLQVDQIRARIATTAATKTGKIRHVPLPLRSAQNLAQSARHLDCAFVLRNPDTGTRYLAMNKGLKAAMRRAGIGDLCWHDLRRTAACRWLQRDGKSMEEVSTLLGHGDVKITSQRYAFLKSEVVAESLSGRTKTGTGTAV
ncbi:tyrosine-type recombinase/integrase [Bradyrhizobium sp. URHD0069]|uniref:tyrosine-type recombinase/integrase n=1 Tax=Bradyrhizobium sp. URHD0069 TaxID=1380355 RepID=UPI0035289FEF